MDCHVIIGGDFNVDLSRLWVHSAMLKVFATMLVYSLVTWDLHQNFNIDYSYHFGMNRFSVLDHFLLSEMLFTMSVSSVHVIHDIDNTSDHEPIVLQLGLQMKLNLFSVLTERLCHRLLGLKLVPAIMIIIARDSIYAKRAYAIAIPSVRLSVCLSVTRVIHAKTVVVRIVQFSQYSSPIPLVFAR